MTPRDRELLATAAKLNREMGTIATCLLLDLEKQDTLSADKLAELGSIVGDFVTLIEKRVAELRSGGPQVIEGGMD